MFFWDNAVIKSPELIPCPQAQPLGLPAGFVYLLIQINVNPIGRIPPAYVIKGPIALDIGAPEPSSLGKKTNTLENINLGIKVKIIFFILIAF